MNIFFLVLLLISSAVCGQGGPPTAPPLVPPVDPVGNVSSADKVLLGKVLYWDEQLSSSKTVACASCHIFSSGGTDPRADQNNPLSINPGFDQQFNTADDVVASPGVTERCDNGEYIYNQTYGYKLQVTGKKAPSVINAAYANSLFWDGRATDQLIDPITNVLVLSSGAALESQILGPPTSSVEMGHNGRDWNDVIHSVASSSPLALSPSLSTELTTWIGSASYYQLFNRVYGSSDISASKIAMAIASYERSLFSDQSPFDDNLRGNQNALNQQQRRGLAVFRGALCGGCHSGALMSDNNFHNIGVTPNSEDEGRFAVTGLNSDRGRFKTPPLRNLALRASFMHTGSFSSLEEVVDFYDRGGDFNNPNLDPRMVPLNLSQNQKGDLVAFLRDGLSDDRVANETGVFSSPVLYSESNRVPVTSGSGVVGTNGLEPIITAVEPPLLGNKNFTVAIENAKENSPSVFVVGLFDPGLDALPNAADHLYYLTKDLSSTNSMGHASLSFELPSNPELDGTSLYGRWYVEDDQAANGYAISALMELTLFGPGVGTAGQIFSSKFEAAPTTCN